MQSNCVKMEPLNGLFSFPSKGVMPTEISEHMKKTINTISRELDISNRPQRDQNS